MHVLRALLSLSLVSLISAHPSPPKAISFGPRHPNSYELAVASGHEGPTKTTALIPRASEKDSDKKSGKSKVGGAGGAAGAALAVLFLADGIVTGIKDMIDEDKLARSEFTQTLVDQLSSQDPNKNYVVVYTKHTAKFDGKQGTDWDVKHIKYDVKIGKDIDYKVYVSQKGGTFQLKGDGGYLNWAYGGYVDSSKSNSKKIVFTDAPESSGTETAASAAEVPTEAGEGLDAGDVIGLIL